MNLIEAFEAENTSAIDDIIATANGMPFFSKTGSALLDLFTRIGSARAGQNKFAKQVLDLGKEFDAAFADNAVWTIRILLWARDVRGGAGEREVVRRLMKRLESRYPEVVIRILPKLVEVGRWDDILVFDTPVVERAAFDLMWNAIRNKDGLAAKWAPRRNSKVAATRAKAKRFAALAYPKAPNQDAAERLYRKAVVAVSNTVEQTMSGRKWSEVDYEKVPSLASIRYKNAFSRHDAARYADFNAKLETGDAKVNASAVFPYNIVEQIRNDGGSTAMHEAMWEALPDYTNGTSIFPMIDVSSSMGMYHDGKALSPIILSMSLGLYLSMKNKGPFQDAFMTFDSCPKFMKLEGNLGKRLDELAESPWGGSTDINAAFDNLLDVAVKHGVAPEDMPKSIVILSDMQFDENNRYGGSGFVVDGIRDRYEAAGYPMPSLIFWNLGTEAGSHVGFDHRGFVAVSGFSPSNLKMVLGELSTKSPFDAMIELLKDSRYDW